MPGFAVESWIGLFAPAQSPAPLVERMNAAVRAALAKPEVAARLASLDAEIAMEPDRVREAYRVRASRLEPVGLVYLWPALN